MPDDVTDKTNKKSGLQVIQILDLAVRVLKMTMVKMLRETEGEKDKIEFVYFFFFLENFKRVGSLKKKRMYILDQVSVTYNLWAKPNLLPGFACFTEIQPWSLIVYERSFDKTAELSS